MPEKTMNELFYDTLRDYAIRAMLKPLSEMPRATQTPELTQLNQTNMAETDSAGAPWAAGRP